HQEAPHARACATASRQIAGARSAHGATTIATGTGISAHVVRDSIRTWAARDANVADVARKPSVAARGIAAVSKRARIPVAGPHSALTRRHQWSTIRRHSERS